MDACDEELLGLEYSRESRESRHGSRTELPMQPRSPRSLATDKGLPAVKRLFSTVNVNVSRRVSLPKLMSQYIIFHINIISMIVTTADSNASHWQSSSGYVQLE